MPSSLSPSLFSKLLFSFLLSLLFPLVLFSSSSISTATTAAIINTNTSTYNYNPPHQKCLKRGFDLSYSDTNLSSWNANNPDCCSWEGIHCSSFTGHVIALNLSRLHIGGLLNFQSLFQLGSLQRLNLSDNFFEGSPIPSGFAQLSNLTHLHLRWNQFCGQIPLDIFHLTRLVSLDLSYNEYYNLSSNSFAHLYLERSSSGMEQLFGNLSGLRELFLDWANLSAMGSQWSRILSYALPNLHQLSMFDCSLSGPIHPSISHLHFLTLLDLSSNHLSSPMPESISNLTSLTALRLLHCDLHHKFPTGVFNMPKLQSLHISGNQFLTIDFPNFSINSTIQVLEISGCNIQGSIPTGIFSLTELQYLRLSSNHFSGVVDLGSFQNLKNLKTLDLSYNNFSTIVHTRNSSTSITQPSVNLSQLSNLLLSNNNFQGPIPNFIFELTELLYLDLSSNHFSGVVDLGSFQNFKNLKTLDLSDNCLTVTIDPESSLISTSFPQIQFLSLRSGNISKFPNMLRNQEEIESLDLSRNRIGGKIPQRIWKVGNGRMYSLNLSNNALERLEGPFPHLSLTSMEFLDLSSNLLKGSILIPPPSSSFFSLANNTLDGEVPSLICDAKFLEVLDFSSNFTGLIPQCLGEISTFIVLNLGKNAFHGPLLQTFKVRCMLETLDLSGNQLEGRMPKSLVNCQMLTVLNLGNNQIQDEFPSQLGNLSNLHVLIVRSNNFFGSIGEPCTRQEFFPQLQIIDISFNNFSGRLPSNLFSARKMMKDGGSASEFLTANTSDTSMYYQDKVFLVWKGLEVEFVKILMAVTVVDLSYNKFYGDIPISIRELKALHVLNLSHNHFQGEIPASLQNLKELESLDLSNNNLFGKIPWQLVELSFLEVLNLSQNQLIGRIPQGRHFDTFQNDSFLGIWDLCGLPLSRKCEEDAAVMPPATQATQSDDDESEPDFMWIAFGVGHGVGFGMFFWTLALWRRGRRAFLMVRPDYNAPGLLDLGGNGCNNLGSGGQPELPL
ncbi:hypothetical protein ACLOJK_038022 [Asimina triloba]